LGGFFINTKPKPIIVRGIRSATSDIIYQKAIIKSRFIETNVRIILETYALKLHAMFLSSFVGLGGDLNQNQLLSG
jgi:hypothetical protein